MACLHIGDGVPTKLSSAYPADGRLIIETRNATKEFGACCTPGFLRIPYACVNGKFKIFGIIDMRKPLDPPPHWPFDPDIFMTYNYSALPAAAPDAQAH
jgi:hypothetical protein